MDAPRTVLVATVAVLLVAWGPAAGGEKPAPAARPPRVHMISGSKEYKSAESLPAFAAYLARSCGIACTVSLADDGGKDIPDLDKLDGADVLLIFCRRNKATGGDLEKIKAWFAAGKPAIGIRTASHAFQGFLEMDKQVFGGSYKGHGGGETVDVKLDEKNAAHPILKGVEPWTREGKLYRNKDNATDTVTLLTGTGAKSKDVEPVAWARVYDKDKDGRCFYTSMGYVHDFGNANFARLLVNAIHWVAARPAPKFEPPPPAAEGAPAPKKAPSAGGGARGHSRGAALVVPP